MVTIGNDSAPSEEPAGPVDAAIGARLAWMILVASVLLVLAYADLSLTVALQFHHSWAVRNGRRPRGWPVTLGLQALLVYAFVLPSVNAYVGALGGFLAGSVLLLVPGRWRWPLYAAVTASYSVLYTVVPVRGNAYSRTRTRWKPTERTAQTPSC
jgi:hypothetical protein